MSDVCVCFQVWNKNDQSLRRSLVCPFINDTGKSSLMLSSLSVCLEGERWVVHCHFADLSDVHTPDLFQNNVWENVSVSLSQRRMNFRSVLWWNLSAPCRLAGEVWPCRQGGSEENGAFRQQLANGTWRQNRNGQWVRKWEYWALYLEC